MMRPEIIKTHATQIHEVTSEFVDKMRALRDPETLELPNDFMNELFKWSLECEYTYVCEKIAKYLCCRYFMILFESGALKNDTDTSFICNDIEFRKLNFREKKICYFIFILD